MKGQGKEETHTHRLRKCCHTDELFKKESYRKCVRFMENGGPLRYIPWSKNPASKEKRPYKINARGALRNLMRVSVEGRYP